MSHRPHPITGRSLDAALLSFDLHDQLAQLKTEDVWRTGERNAITLMKGHGLRVVLMAMHAGVTLPSTKLTRPSRCR